MNDIPLAFAKLAGILKSVHSLLAQKEGNRAVWAFSKVDAEAYFRGSVGLLEILRKQLPQLFGDFPQIDPEPRASVGEDLYYGREQVERLARNIEQIFEIRAHSELAAPADALQEPRVFISHGRANDWHEVQAYIERDIGIRTLELAQEPNFGRTVLQKLEEESSRCTSAVIVMTGDDVAADGSARARENVLHEIGYFQGKFGLSAICLLHEEGTNIPSNIHGLVYIPFPKGLVSATFGLLARELKSLYQRRPLAS